MKRILIVSDLHVGSNVAIMPDEVWIEKNDQPRANVITANEVQKALYQAWQEMVDRVGRVSACFVLGDSCDGSNIKSRGFELWTSNIHQQCKTAADLLSMVKTNKYYGVQGSYYHVGENTSSDLAIIDMLHGTFGTDLVVNIAGKRIHLCHEIGVSTSPVSKATALQSEIVSAELNQYYGKFDLLLRGHRHEYREVRDHRGHIAICPAWKVRDAYAAKKGLKLSPHIGYLVLNIQGSDMWLEPHLVPVKAEHLFKEVQA